ncbi:hypothetical protein ACKI1I_20555 [Streptomyces turgidiscabies]|uniref:Uncharacterized protein n=1 Tax=Streptomyces turgidiscabies (strain Car8) TaxID=698760 RepID=L7FFR7_STRT8|nr:MULTISPECIES: hypothetical protein [Streptomyces]ELP70152.1 hypothetical protein STRTUCAR8_10135 [Streptomyces turgidiscabies Car8]MDX3496685.1 hypothetical protein [Streptomyces turgidiscabies]
MNVLICVTRGTWLPRPLRLLPEVPTCPEHDGRKYPDGAMGDFDGDDRGPLRAGPASREFGCCGAPGPTA